MNSLYLIPHSLRIMLVTPYFYHNVTVIHPLFCILICSCVYYFSRLSKSIEKVLNRKKRGVRGVAPCDGGRVCGRHLIPKECCKDAAYAAFAMRPV